MTIYHVRDVLRVKEKQYFLLENVLSALVEVQKLNSSPFLRQEEITESRIECLEHIIGELGMHFEDLEIAIRSCEREIARFHGNDL